VKKHQREKEEREKTDTAIAGLQHMQQLQRRTPAMPLSPMLAVSQTMQATTLGGQHSSQPMTRNTTQAATNNTNLFTSQSGGQGTLFHPPPLPGKTSTGFMGRLSCLINAYAWRMDLLCTCRWYGRGYWS